jgi:hypothetical protein
LGGRRPIPAEPARRPSTALPMTRPLKSPKSKSEADKTVLMGEVARTSGITPQASQPNPQLEAALDRLLKGIRLCRGG